MALATQCPHCQTTFRVAQDQLKLRTGLVRCGYCKEIFNGIEHLLPPDEAPQSAPAPIPAMPDIAGIIARRMPAAAVPASKPADAEHPVQKTPAAPPSAIGFEMPAGFERENEIKPEEALQQAPVPDDPLQRMTLIDFTRDLPDSMADAQDEKTEPEFSNAEEDPIAANSVPPDDLDEVIDELQRKPWRGTQGSASEENADVLDAVDTEKDGEDEPDFLRRARQRQHVEQRLRIFLSAGILVLFIAALAQSTYFFRNQIASLFPQSKAALVHVCDILGCRIDLPAEITSVSIESSELQALNAGKDTFNLALLLRNDSTTLQQWPDIELTLNDANEKPLMRRVFQPLEYLGNAKDVRIGFAAASEHSVKLSFSLAQIRASGYRVYLFYP